MAAGHPVALKQLNSLDKKRTQRETKWKESDIYEEAIIKPYLEYTQLSDEDWMSRLHEKIETILRTNATLQEQLGQQETHLEVLRQEHKAKIQDLDEVHSELQTGKTEQQKVEAQLKELRMQRLAEERRLRDRDVKLNEQLAVLGRENCRLEEQRHEEQQQLERGREHLMELAKRAEQLRLRKAQVGLDSTAIGEAYDSEDNLMLRSSTNQLQAAEPASTVFAAPSVLEQGALEVAAPAPRPPSEPKGSNGRSRRHAGSM